MRGSTDRLGLVHVASLPICGLIYGLMPEVHGFYKMLPLLVSAIAGFIEALVLGLKSDELWDKEYNPHSGRTSQAKWPLAVLLVTTMLVGAITVIGTMSRLFDLLYTGGAYG